MKLEGLAYNQQWKKQQKRWRGSGSLLTQVRLLWSASNPLIGEGQEERRRGRQWVWGGRFGGGTIVRGERGERGRGERGCGRERLRGEGTAPLRGRATPPPLRSFPARPAPNLAKAWDRRRQRSFSDRLLLHSPFLSPTNHRKIVIVAARRPKFP